MIDLPPLNGLWFLGGVIVVGLGLVLWAQSSSHPFDIRDTLMDNSTNKASLNACVLAGMAALATWVVVYLTIHGKEVENLVLGVLAIFVLGRLGYQGIKVLEDKKETPNGNGEGQGKPEQYRG